jgi:hypothetical protein
MSIVCTAFVATSVWLVHGRLQEDHPACYVSSSIHDAIFHDEDHQDARSPARRPRGVRACVGPVGGPLSLWPRPPGWLGCSRCNRHRRRARTGVHGRARTAVGLAWQRAGSRWTRPVRRLPRWWGRSSTDRSIEAKHLLCVPRSWFAVLAYVLCQPSCCAPAGSFHPQLRLRTSAQQHSPQPAVLSYRAPHGHGSHSVRGRSGAPRDR